MEYRRIRLCLSFHVHLNYCDLPFLNKNGLKAHGTMTMHPQFLMKMSEGQVSTRNERACRERKGSRAEFYTKALLLCLVFSFTAGGAHATSPLLLISVARCAFKIFRTLVQNYGTDAGLWRRLIKKENSAWKQMFGFWSTNIADAGQISPDFTKSKG